MNAGVFIFEGFIKIMIKIINEKTLNKSKFKCQT